METTTNLAKVEPDQVADNAQGGDLIATTAPVLARMLDAGADIEAAVECWMNALGTIRASAIKRSEPEHWVLNRDNDGHEMATPYKSALRLLQQGFGISVHPDGVPQLKVEDDGSKTATVTGRASSALTGQTAVNIIGERNSKERFTGRGPDAGSQHTGPIHDSDLRKAAMTNLETKSIKMLSGCENVTRQRLETLGIDTARCYRGHGYGSSGQRGAASVAEAGVAELVATLRDDILSCVGGDHSAAQELCYELTKWTSKDGKEGGFRTTDRLTKKWQVENARAKLEAHDLYKNAGEGGAT